MKKQTIAFDKEFIPAILAGQKTQTRRPVSKEDANLLAFLSGIEEDDGGSTEYLGQRFEPQGLRVWTAEYPEEGSDVLKCPYGNIGDELCIKASFIRPKIANLRIERLQDISEEDISAEGVLSSTAPISCFAILWDKFYGNGEGAWNENPWVWVIEFKVYNK